MDKGLRYRIVDSHRNISRRTLEALTDFFCEVKGIDREAGMVQADLCYKWFEKEYAVKWFEIIVNDGSIVAAYMRCFRNPENETQWYFGDVHVRNEYRHRGIASKMYEKAIAELLGYEKAESIITSVHKDNLKSVGLHKKFGFTDTGKRCVFPGLDYEKGETGYFKWLYNFYPVPSNEEACKRMVPLWLKYEEGIHGEKILGSIESVSRKIKRILKKAEKGICAFEAVWCGLRLVGFRYRENGKNITYNIQEEI